MITGPLIPRDVDLRSFDTMPLKVQELRESGFGARSSGDEFRAGVMLWCASFHQVPAGSVPSDDFDLSILAGYGRAVDAWKRLRSGALHGFVDGGDGRLYHKTVCRVAFFDCWLPRLVWLHEKEDERVRKHNKQHETAPSKQISRPSLVSFVRRHYPHTAAYLDVLDQLSPPIGWTLLQKRQRRGFVLPEILPLPPELKADRAVFSAGSGDSSGGKSDAGGCGGAGFPEETALKETERRGKEDNPPTPLEGGETPDDDGFAELLAVGGERWRGMRSDRARPEWDARLNDGVPPPLLVAAARAYFAWREGEDKRTGRVGTVVSPVTFLRSHWTQFRASAELAVERAAQTGPEWGEYSERLADLLGPAVFASWFANATLDDGPPVTITVEKVFVAKWITTNFHSALRRVFGEDVAVKVAAA
jgi:hypothetical protein